jgi:uncharacterized membrane protein YtjA (UPF0391 family)
VYKWIVLCLLLGTASVIVAIVAGLFSLSGIAGVATDVAWVFFGIGVALALIIFFRGRGRPEA